MRTGTRLLAALTVLFLAIPPALDADPLAERTPADRAAALIRGEELRRSSTGRDASVAWTPAHPLAARVETALREEEPDVVVEALYLWKKPRSLAPEPELAAIYNVLRAVGSLQGIEYWSASRQTMRLFYEESWRVVSPEDRTRVPDERVGAVPPSETFTVWQKDLSFGGNLNRLDYRTAPDGVLLESVNLTRMYYKFVPVAAPGTLKVRVLVLNTDEGLLFWAVSSARAAVVPGVRGKLEDSFGNRAEAVFRWFSAKAGEAWKGL